MVNYDFFTADGAIGLGFIPEATDDESIEEDTNFMSMVLDNVKHKNHKISKRIFGLFIQSKGAYQRDYVLTIGKINDEYVLRKETDKLKWIRTIKNTAYYWVLPLKKLIFHVSDVNIKTTNYSNNEIEF